LPESAANYGYKYPELLDRIRQVSKDRSQRFRKCSIWQMVRVIPQDFIIHTASCLLRRPTAADIPHVFAATRFAGFNDGMQWEAPATMDELDEPFQESWRDWDEGITYGFTIANPASNSLLGRIGVRKTNRTDIWNLGFWTHPEHQGRGYMTESVRAILTFGFDRLGANQIEASYALWNKSSRRVLEKVGMKFIAYIPHAFRKQGRWIEANKMSITQREWLISNSDRYIDPDLY
jgi:[ribosomal protein S5]-alanine N-acetyltransferase